jgi:hypothetical protein
MACQSSGRMTLKAVAGGAATVPGAPKSLSTSSIGGSVTLTWSAPLSADATDYIVEGGSARIGNGTYYVRIRAQNAAGISAASNELALVVGSSACTSAANAPGGLAITTSGGTVSLTDTFVGDETNSFSLRKQ